MKNLETRSDAAPDSRIPPDSAGQADVEAGLVRRLSIFSLLPLVAIGGAVGAVARWGVQHLTIELGGAMGGRCSWSTCWVPSCSGFSSPGSIRVFQV